MGFEIRCQVVKRGHLEGGAESLQTASPSKLVLQRQITFAGKRCPASFLHLPRCLPVLLRDLRMWDVSAVDDIGR